MTCICGKLPGEEDSSQSGQKPIKHRDRFNDLIVMDPLYSYGRKFPGAHSVSLSRIDSSVEFELAYH